MKNDKKIPIVVVIIVVLIVLVGGIFYAKSKDSVKPAPEPVSQDSSVAADAQNQDAVLTAPTTASPKPAPVAQPKVTTVSTTSTTPKTKPTVTIVSSSVQFASSSHLTSGGSVPSIAYASYDKNLSPGVNGQIHSNANMYIQGSNFGTCAQRKGTGCTVQVFLDKKSMPVVFLSDNLIIAKLSNLELGTRQLYLRNSGTRQNSNPITLIATE